MYGDERIMDVDEGKDATCTCGSKDETAHNGKEGEDEDRYDRAWGEDVINRMDGIWVGGNGSARFNDASSNGFANGGNVDLVLVFDSMLWWCFPLMSALILDKKSDDWHHKFFISLFY